jgi:glycolate oxidase subunit GlcD
VDTLVKNLRAVLKPEQVVSDPEELLVFECDGLTHYRHAPRAVVFPQSTDEVSEVMRVLARGRVPFVPRGAGTGLSGGALAVGGGVCIELARMRRVLKIDVENRLAVVEAGVVNAQVSRAVARHGLYYVPDPSSQVSCTVGGNIAENAGGIHCLKYGTTVDHVLGARVVLAGGRVVELGGAGAENVGYDLLGVFVGSEGTFGIATEATLRLTPVAPSVRTLLADFTNIDDASRAVSAIIAAGIMPAALEMVDGATILAVEASVFAAGLPLDAEAALLVELDGLEAGLDEEVALVRSICKQNGGRGVRLAADESERKKLWAARKGAFGAMGRITPDILIQDAVVPRSRLPEVLAATYRIGAKYHLRVANVFHAGDGNLHPLVCFDSRDADEVVRVREAGREIMKTCVRAGGTITGEHGVGLDKSEYLPLVFSDDDLRAMLRVREAFDPSGLCNPGKVIPALKGCGEARAVAEGKWAAQTKVERASDTDGAVIEGKRQEGQGKGPKVEAADALSESLSTTSSAHLSSASTRSSSGVRGAFDADCAFVSFARLVGEAHVAAGELEDGFDDATPAVVVAPASFEEVCEVLKIAAGEGWKVVPAGAGTWLDAGNRSRRVEVVLQTTRLPRTVEHEPADLVATAGAGVTLAVFNGEVGRAGQWLPLDPPGEVRMTLGGVAATGMGGAQAHGYGTPRAYVLGMRVALAGGEVIRVGSRVVKNVAGYDLCKLFVGSHGTLGVILELTFKLRPRPAREATLIARAAEPGALLHASRAVGGGQLLPVALEIISTSMARVLGLKCEDREHFLLARFAGRAEAVEFQLARAAELCAECVGGAGVEMLSDDAAVWSSLAAVVARGEHSLVWRASVLPAEFGSLLERVHAGRGSTGELKWHAGAGDGRLRVFDAAEREDAQTIATLRSMREAARAAGGALVIERAPLWLKREFDSWGLKDSAAFLMSRVKEQLDPGDFLSPGRFAFE